MRIDCVTAPEFTSLTRASSLVRTDESVAISEVGVPVTLDLLDLCVPVATVSYPAEKRHPPTEACDRPRIGVFVTLNRHLQDGPIQRTPRSIEGDRGTVVFLMPSRDTGRWGNEA